MADLPPATGPLFRPKSRTGVTVLALLALVFFGAFGAGLIYAGGTFGGVFFIVLGLVFAAVMFAVRGRYPARR